MKVKHLPTQRLQGTISFLWY